MTRIDQIGIVVSSISSREISLGMVMRLACLIFIVSMAGFGQRDEPIRVQTELVGFEVKATDKDGRPVSGLTADRFRVFENGVERKIDFFQPMSRVVGNRPLAVVFALDISGSMTKAELELLRSSLSQFVRRLEGPETYFSVITFAMNVKTVVPLTNRRQRLDERLGRIRHDREGLSTHAYDAIDAAVRSIVRNGPKTGPGRIPQRAVIVITDGFPVGDVVSSKTVIERANKAGVSVHSVILPSFSRVGRDRTPIITPFEASGLTEATGGISIAAKEKNLDPILSRLALAIDESYVIALYPTRDPRVGNGFQTVTIESTDGYEIKQNRSGYLIRE